MQQTSNSPPTTEQGPVVGSTTPLESFIRPLDPALLGQQLIEAAFQAGNREFFPFEEIKQLRQVNKHLKALADEFTSIKKLVSRKSSHVPRMLEDCAALLPNVDDLTISILEPLSSEGAMALLDYNYPALRKLHINCGKGVSVTVAEQLLPNLKNLTSLAFCFPIIETNIFYALATNKHFSALKELLLSAHGQNGDILDVSSVQAIALDMFQNLKSVEVLALACSRYFSLAAGSLIFSKNCLPQLQELSISGSLPSGSIGSPLVLPLWPRLRALHSYGISPRLLEGITSTPWFKNLKSLDIKGIRDLSASDYATLEGEGQQLEELIIDFEVAPVPEAFKALRFRKLKKLHVCEEYSD